MLSPRSSISGLLGNGSRDMSGALLVLVRSRHLELTNCELPVEVGKLAASVLQKKLPLQQQDRAEYVAKQNGSRAANRWSVRVKQDRFVLGHELQLAHEPKTVGQQESDGD